MSCLKRTSELKDKVVLITGSSSGIGKQTALHFASLGAKVVVTGRRENAIVEVCQLCQNLSPCEYKPIGIVADLDKEDEIRNLMKCTIDAYGRLDVLVNNAGYGIISPIDNLNLMEVYQKMMDTLAKVPLLLISLAVPYLEKTKGCIVNVSSMAGMKPFNKWTAYCMAKAALDMMTNCLAIELGPKGIRVNNVNPAYVATNFQSTMGITTDQNLAFRKLQESQYPLGRVGESSDVANAIIFLASDDAAWISGAIMNLDGGAKYVMTLE